MKFDTSKKYTLGQESTYKFKGLVFESNIPNTYSDVLTDLDGQPFGFFDNAIVNRTYVAKFDCMKEVEEPKKYQVAYNTEENLRYRVSHNMFESLDEFSDTWNTRMLGTLKNAQLLS